MKKVLSIVLSLVMLLSMSVTAFAAENRPVAVDNSAVQIVEANGVRTATYSDETTTYIVTYDTVKNTICVSQKDIETGEISYGTTVSTNVSTVTTRAASSTIHQDTFSNYEYDIYTGNPNEWNLERPDDDGSGQVYFMVYENNFDDSAKEVVDRLMQTQNEVVYGPEWYAGDHAAFAFRGIPCMVLTSSDLFEGGLDHTHTMRDITSRHTDDLRSARHIDPGTNRQWSDCGICWLRRGVQIDRR